MLKGSQIGWLLVASGLVIALEFLELAGITFPPPLAIPFFSLLILAIGHETLLNGFKALYRLDFSSINLLMVIACIGAMALGQYTEAAVVIVLFNLAERLEDIGIERSQSAFDRLIDKMPKTVNIQGLSAPIPADQAKPGQILIVRPGEIIALDGIVRSGNSLVDESTITGEPLPRDKRKGDTVFAGTMNEQGYLEIEITHAAANSTIAKIRELTFDSLKNKAPAQQFIERFSAIYTPAIITLAVGWTLGSWLLLGRPFLVGFSDALSLLVIGCPCALVISTPISIFSAIGNASTQGILIKGGRYLEALGQVKAIAFDKTRTLTVGTPKVTDVIPYGDNSREHILGCAAGIELLSDHPLAKSIVKAAEDEKAPPHAVENFTNLVGKGAKADCLVCDEKHHCIGKLEFILEEHTVPNEVKEQIAKLQQQGKTVVVVCTHKEVEGLIALEDEIRASSLPLINELTAQGVHVVMLTGDHRLSAEAVAKQIGIDEVMADLLPQDKAAAIMAMEKKYGIVGMVGDGINDAPALACAQVGISMSTLGSDTALEAASVVILKDHLESIPFLIGLGRKALRIIRFNTAGAIIVKFLIIGLALAGMANLAMAVFADVGVTLLVILNSLRLMNYSKA